MLPTVSPVTGKEPDFNPENATLFGVEKQLTGSSRKIHTCCIDLDSSTPWEKIVEEIVRKER